MAKERVTTYRNTGTETEPVWEKYYNKTVADAVMMSDSDGETKNIKQYVDESIDNLVNGAPETMDTLKELSDAIAENESTVEAINSAITSKADKSQLFFTNSTPTVQAHGGVAAGTTFDEMPITDVLNKILYPWVAPVVKAMILAPTYSSFVFEKGDTPTVTKIGVTVTKKSAKITGVEIFDNDISLGSASEDDINSFNTSSLSNKTFSFPVSVSVNTNKSFTAKVTDADTKVTSANIGTFSFVYPYYQGVIAADATADEAAVKALTKLIQAKGTKAVTYTASNQKMVFAVPKANGVIKTITDQNGFTVTDTFTQSEISITGLDGTAQDYYVYVSGATTVSAFKMTFAH